MRQINQGNNEFSTIYSAVVWPPADAAVQSVVEPCNIAVYLHSKNPYLHYLARRVIKSDKTCSTIGPFIGTLSQSPAQSGNPSCSDLSQSGNPGLGPLVLLPNPKFNVSDTCLSFTFVLWRQAFSQWMRHLKSKVCLWVKLRYSGVIWTYGR